MLPARKLKDLQGPKSRSRPLPRDAMLPPNEMCFRCTVLEKWHQNFQSQNFRSRLFFFGIAKKVLRKVCQPNVNEKRNLMVLVSVA